MAGVLKSFNLRDNFLISILVVSTAEFCGLIAEGLLKSAAARKCRILVHQCELISDIVRKQRSLHVDFIVFAYDPRLRATLEEVESNIALIDEHFIVCGWTCLVNGYNIRSAMGVTSNLSWEIRTKYNLRFFTANIFDAEDCLRLCNSIINLTSATLGLRSGTPVLDSLNRYHHLTMPESD